MTVATGVSRADALAAAVEEVCRYLEPHRRWKADADDPRQRFQGQYATAGISCMFNHAASCARGRGGKGMTVERVRGQDCCHWFSWDELFAACDGAPRQAGLL